MRPRASPVRLRRATIDSKRVSKYQTIATVAATLIVETIVTKVVWFTRIGRPRMKWLVMRRLPGMVASAKPSRKIGMPPGPGIAMPMTGEASMSSQPMTFLTMNQNWRRSEKTPDGDTGISAVEYAMGRGDGVGGGSVVMRLAGEGEGCGRTRGPARAAIVSVDLARATARRYISSMEQTHMDRDIDRVLISRERIEQRVRELAAEITADHTPADGGEAPEVSIVPLLTGAMIFCADLIRCIPIPMKIGLMTVSSYPGTSIRSQGVNVLTKQLGNVTGRHVVLLDDILDSGQTIRAVVPILKELGAASVRVCVLLRKDRPEAKDTPCDYVGFDIPDEFVVGYGLDFDDVYRNLPDVVVLKPDVIGRGTH
jgi:hypoxanthine phosphoribosyltransferase